MMRRFSGDVDRKSVARQDEKIRVWHSVYASGRPLILAADVTAGFVGDDEWRGQESGAGFGFCLVRNDVFDRSGKTAAILCDVRDHCDVEPAAFAISWRSGNKCRLIAYPPQLWSRLERCFNVVTVAARVRGVNP